MDHKFISPEEKNYLIRNISSSEMSINNETKSLMGRKGVQVRRRKQTSKNKLFYPIFELIKDISVESNVDF